MNLKHAVWHTLKEALAYWPPRLKGTIPYHLVYKVRKASLSQGVTRSGLPRVIPPSSVAGL